MNWLYFRVSMPHSRSVIRITVADNPPEKAPPYPGKYSRNQKGGATMTRDEWLQEHTDRWVHHMGGKPAYNQTYQSDKALVLHSHLSRILPTLHRGKADYIR